MSMDHNYARGKLTLLLRDLSNYNAGEFWREMSRIASGATACIHAEGLKVERDAMADSNTQLKQQNDAQIRMNAKLMRERDEYHNHREARIKADSLERFIEIYLSPGLAHNRATGELQTLRKLAEGHQ